MGFRVSWITVKLLPGEKYFKVNVITGILVLGKKEYWGKGKYLNI